MVFNNRHLHFRPPSRGIKNIMYIVFLCALCARVVADANYLIMSLPSLRQIAYAKLPSNVLRILVPPTGGLVTPKGICVDAENHRLFVTDEPTMKIVWYQLIALPDGKLITDGQQRTAVASVVSSWCTVDGLGNLFFSGRMIDPLSTAAPKNAIYKHDSINIATRITTNPVLVWSDTNHGTQPCVVAPSGIQTDDFSLFWGSKEQGAVNGVLCRGPATPPEVNALSLSVANNEESSRGLALTSRFLFYTTQNAIYGVAKGKNYAGCANAGDCVKVSGDVSDPNGMVWDRDGTVYIADTGRQSKSGETGVVLSFPSGSLAPHVLSPVVDAHGVHDVAILQVSSEAARNGVRTYLLHVAWLLAVAA
eukprot:GEMP01050306.1.p1 GENE.GEMP01050306.1~~GEMP01050306.1.p1  ORF type:complete len:364 (+),score=75.55 GEMP01050306.1:75-1166(+)